MQRITRNQKPLQAKKPVTARIHKIYLLTALLIGLLFALAMPFFNEPDGQYHYNQASNIAGLSNDIRHYGETDQWYGDQYQHQVAAYRDGTFFDKYFVTKIKKIPMSQLPRANTLPPVMSYNYLSHLLPAAGVWLGYHLYPSMGVMIVTGRLVTMFVCTLAMFFIIRYVRRAKLFFAAVSLLPVVINNFASLGYDSLSFVLVAWLVAMNINLIDQRKVTLRQAVALLAVSAFSFFAMKTNFLLLLALFPLVAFGLWWQRQEQIKRWLWRRKWLLIVFIALIVVVGSFFALHILSDYGGTTRALYRLAINPLYAFDGSNYSAAPTTLVQPFVFGTGQMPIWTVGVWFILLWALAFSETRYVRSQIVSYGSLAIFVGGIVATYISFLSFTVPITPQGVMGQITGVQGRYFTPTLLLFAIFAGNTRFKLKINRTGTLLVATVLIALATNLMLIFNTLFAIKYMV